MQVPAIAAAQPAPQQSSSTRVSRGAHQAAAALRRSDARDLEHSYLIDVTTAVDWTGKSREQFAPCLKFKAGRHLRS